jgi:hypothetical protein
LAAWKPNGLADIETKRQDKITAGQMFAEKNQDRDPAVGSEKELEQQKRWQQPLQTGNRNSKRDTANLTGAHSERKASSQKDKDPVHWNTAPWTEVTGVKTGRDQKGFEQGSEIQTGALACGTKTK